jgi:hypothetical protein
LASWIPFFDDWVTEITTLEEESDIEWEFVGTARTTDDICDDNSEGSVEFVTVESNKVQFEVPAECLYNDDLEWNVDEDDDYPEQWVKHNDNEDSDSDDDMPELMPRRFEERDDSEYDSDDSDNDVPELELRAEQDSDTDSEDSDSDDDDSMPPLMDRNGNIVDFDRNNNMIDEDGYIVDFMDQDNNIVEAVLAIDEDSPPARIQRNSKQGVSHEISSWNTLLPTPLSKTAYRRGDS